MNDQFTMDDLRKIRNANSERHLKMTSKQVLEETIKKSDITLKKIEKIRKN